MFEVLKTHICIVFACCVVCVFSHSVVSSSLQHQGLQPARLLCPWGFSRQEYWRGLLCPPPRDLSDPGIEPRSLELQADSLPSEPSGKPYIVFTGCILYYLLKIFIKSLLFFFLAWIFSYFKNTSKERKRVFLMICTQRFNFFLLNI